MKEIAQHILDIANNSVRAKATLIEISINEDLDNDNYVVTISDNGEGIPEDKLEAVCDPFVTSRTTRKVGLGIPLLKLNAERTNGSFHIESELGKGTTIKAVFKHKNVDRPVIGDIAGVVTMLAATDQKIDVVYIHAKQSNEYIFDTREIKNELDNVSISNPQIMRFIKEMIEENLESINYTK
ncbi:MAG: ATP-binding protein [Salinivirgaceae bacterium]